MLKKLLRKISLREKWNNIEYPISEGPLTEKIINKMVNKLWIDYFNGGTNLKEDNYLILMFRVRLINGDIKTLTKLQRLKFNSKEYLKSYLAFKSNIISDAYNSSPIKGVIFSWGIRENKNLRKEFIDTVIEALKPIENKSFTHSFRMVKDIPIDTDLNLYGVYLNNTESFKSIAIPKNRIINIEITTNLEGLELRKFSLIKNNKIRLNWEDKITSLEKNSLIRTIGNTIIDFEDGAIVYQRIVIPLKRITKIKPHKKNNKNIIAADLETIVKNNTMKPYLASFSSSKEVKSFFLSNNNNKILFSDFFNAIFSRKYKNFRIYFHNLSSFDGVFLIKRLVDLKYNIELKIHGGKLIQIKVQKSGLNFYINDSLLIMLNSLEKLGKNFVRDAETKGIFPFLLTDIRYKGDFPDYELFTKISIREYEEEARKFKKTPWNFKMESIKYCINDSVLLRKILNSFSDFIFNHFKIDINKYPTISSLAFAIFRNRYLKEGEVGIIPTNSKIYKNIRQAYTGGSIDMFIPSNFSNNILNRILNKKIYVYDVNSLYPYVMSKFEYPIGDASYIEIPEERNDLNMNLSLFGFFYAQVEAPNNLNHPILQIHHPLTKRTISPLGKFSGWFFSEELKNSLKFGYKIKITKGYNFDKGFIFRDWVKDLYNIRISYDKSHPMNFISKILLNSLYGRFGMGELGGSYEIVNRKEFNSLTETDRIDILDTIDLGKNILIQYKDTVSLSNELCDASTNINIAISAAVTAYARIHMSQFKNNPAFPNLYYTDTDSLYFDGPLPDSFISPTILGALKLEGIYDKALFLAPKFYALENLTTGEKIIKIKGLKNEVFKDISLDSLIPLLTKGEKLNFQQNKWFKSFDQATISIIDTVYSLRVTDNKRELIYSYDNILIGTRPLKL